MRAPTSLPPRLRRRAGIRSLAARAAVVALVAGGLVGFGGGAPASAQSTSAPTFNCYTIWWSTAYNQRCYSGGAEKAGYYKSNVDCSGADGGRSLERWRNVGSTNTYKGGDCNFGITNGWIYYRAS